MSEDLFPHHLRVATNKILNEGEVSSTRHVNNNSKEFKVLKNELRLNETVIGCFVNYLFLILQRSCAKKRHTILSLINYFFNRSHVFRLNIIERLQELLNLVCEADPLHFPLSLPSDGGKELKTYAIKTIKQWNEKFAVGYIKLQTVAEFLRVSKSVDYESVTAELLAEKKRRDEEDKRRAEKAEKMANIVEKKYYDMKLDIERTINEVRNGLQILVPLFGIDGGVNESLTTNHLNFYKSHSNVSENALHGYLREDVVTVTINSAIPNVVLNEDNRVVAENVRDARIMLDVYRKYVVSWLQKLSNVSKTHSTVKELIDLKRKLDDYSQRVDELQLAFPNRKSKNTYDNGSEDESSDLEDVPEKEEEIFVSPYHIPNHIMEKIRNVEDFEKPCCSKSGAQNSQSIPLESSRTSKTIPVVSFDIDLKYWGEKRDPVEGLKNDIGSTIQQSTFDCRVFSFPGEERRSNKQCRARLLSGKLCPRKDFEKCPLHGTIVERNEHGFPMELSQIRVNNAEHMTTTKKEEEEYLRDLEAATGKDLSLKTKRGQRGSHCKETNVRKRLEKKLLNKRTIKRVSEVLDSMRKAKMQKMFGGQFAHSLSR